MCKLKGAPVPGPRNEERENSCTENITDLNVIYLPMVPPPLSFIYTLIYLCSSLWKPTHIYDLL